VVETNSRGVPSAPTPTRVTFVVDTRAYGGAETYVTRLLEHLPERFERSLAVVEPVPEQLADAAGRLRVHLVRMKRVRTKYDLIRLVRQARAVAGSQPDLVHVNLATVSHSRHVLGVLAMSGTPSIVTLHSTVKIGSGLQRRILRSAYKRLAGAIAVSRESHGQLCHELGIDPRSVGLIANGVAVREPLPREVNATVRLGALGRLSREKGLDVLIEAIRRRPTNEGVTLVIAGDGPELPALERQAAGLPVVFAGRVEATSFLADLDIFCLPSRTEELPFALLEAMMAGLPSVAARVGDVPDALGSGGLLVPPDDPDALAAAIDELVQSPERRRALGDRAHARAVERYSLERMVAETVAFYDEVIGGA
jgi:glycosyltransferase involved in cell wall biosynthesis